MPAPDPPFPDSRNVIEPDCQRCPALAEHRTCISWGTGPLDADVLVIGEAPGSGNPDADDWQGGNWTGKAYTSRHSGRRIRRMVERIGYGDDAYYTNAVKCFPSNEDSRATTASGEVASTETSATEELPDNREPTPAERTNCRTHLVTEVETLEPAVLLATGKHATKSVLAAEDQELDGFIEMVLEPVRCEQLETWLVPILHPSYQDVWIGRLGYEPEEYLAAIREVVDECVECVECGERDGSA
ncbi:uracil-DNA glycosylase [Natrialba hulunbeirensis JCM 10989]|uniref:Uracil-DNA glycosylase n=1 Tax=Natrialba hulunbeirensis JCM 10989 TaxID=1227493 RepID=L9ZXM3_9EURY|nr:uracil-DNA glycosylase family protein [Natrialba hulunbeirensis]ELY91039.1 uracil-DNA glycosylase [Natrialba hulunbeirensis JCM 10989]